MALIDLSSDTVTRPTAPMYEAMSRAPLGDEQRQDDPTVNALQARVAELLGHEAALLFPSATMANQVSVICHCDAGDEVLCHPTAHVYQFEGGGLARNARVQVRPLSGPRGRFAPEQLTDVFNPDDPHYARTRLVVIENTSNLGGGAVWPLVEYQAVVDRARGLGLRVHLDGARLFNAAVASDSPAASWASRADTVQVCFSKGLGCPFGAVLAGSAETIARARRVKQSMGGALRQAGVIAGAMLYALDQHVTRLADDHRRAHTLARALSQSTEVVLEPVETNLVYFSLRRGAAVAERFAARLVERGVRVHPFGKGRFRACTHLGVDDAAIEVAVATLTEALTGLDELVVG